MEHAYHLQANIDNAVIWADQWKCFTILKSANTCILAQGMRISNIQ